MIWGEPNFVQTLFEDVWSLKMAKHTEQKHMWRFPKMSVHPNGWFIMENPMKMDDLGVHPCQPTRKFHHQTPQSFSCGSWSADRTCFCHAFLITGSNLSRLTRGSSPGKAKIVTWIGLDWKGHDGNLLAKPWEFGSPRISSKRLEGCSRIKSSHIFRLPSTQFWLQCSRQALHSGRLQPSCRSALDRKGPLWRS